MTIHPTNILYILSPPTQETIRVTLQVYLADPQTWLCQHRHKNQRILVPWKLGNLFEILNLNVSAILGRIPLLRNWSIAVLATVTLGDQSVLE